MDRETQLASAKAEARAASQLVRNLKTFGEPLPACDAGEFMANLTLAQRHLEDAVFRLEAAQKVLSLGKSASATAA